jgi:Gram-negative bacterial TonB protein C-terminal
MRNSHSITGLLSLLLPLLSDGPLAPQRANVCLELDAIAKTSYSANCAANEDISQNEKEAAECRGVVRLRRQQLLDLVVKQIPLVPPPMLHNSKLHGKVTVKVSVDERGKVIAVKGVKGHPFAISSAVESVRKWTFMPYKQNGKARCAIGLLLLNYDFSSREPEGGPA